MSSSLFSNGYISLAGRSMTTYGTEPQYDGKRLCLFLRKLLKSLGYALSITQCKLSDADDITTSGSLQFDFKAIEAATCNFHESNKLGHGGFGEVYKA